MHPPVQHGTRLRHIARSYLTEIRRSSSTLQRLEVVDLIEFLFCRSQSTRSKMRSTKADKLEFPEIDKGVLLWVWVYRDIGEK
jgi:hypothetical protein